MNLLCFNCSAKSHYSHLVLLIFCTRNHREVIGSATDNTILLCQIEGKFEKEDISRLGTALSSIVFEETGVIFSWQQPHDDFGVTSTDLLFELASAGLLPTNASANYFGPTGFAAYFKKQDFVIRSPSADDVHSLRAIVSLEKRVR